MRPPIREISANPFGSNDQSWRRAYSGTPLPDTGKPILVEPHRHAPSDTRDLRKPIQFKRSPLVEDVQQPLAATFCTLPCRPLLRWKLPFSLPLLK